MSIKEDFKELFTFSRNEQRGVIILLVILFSLNLAKILYPHFRTHKEYDYSQFEKEIDAFEASKKPLNENNYENRLNKSIIDRYDSLDLFEFDPNELTAETGQKLGLTEKQIKTILNYLDKGGRFYDNDDFRKMYGIRPKQYEILSPYIQIQTNEFEKKKTYKKEKNYEKETDTAQLFEFDPNTNTAEQWKQLGFNEKQISTIENYVSKGGKFKNAEDFGKIYGIRKEQFEAVKSFIKIVQEQKHEKVLRTNIVDINRLSEDEFTVLGGFWKYNASKIIKYRTALGGFIDKSQLYELYGMKKEYVDKIKDSVYIDLKKVTKIRINFADREELSKHPYLSDLNADDIINFRDKNGPFAEIKKIRTAKLISETTFNKIRPYLTEY